MIQTFKQYKKGNATIGDLQEAWKYGQLPDDVAEHFGSHVENVEIRSLEQSGFNLYKDSLIVDNFIKVDDFLLVASREKDWQIVLYQNEEYQEVVFVNNEKNLLKIMMQLLIEYNNK